MDCQNIVLEDLRSFNPPKNQRKLSRKFSNWLRGSLYKVLLYKGAHYNIQIKRVSARWTSTYCPRCGKKGKKIVDSNSQIVDPRSRCFLFSVCGFTADRDYIDELNIYRMYEQTQENLFKLYTAVPVSYMGAGLPCDRPRETPI